MKKYARPFVTLSLLFTLSASAQAPSGGVLPSVVSYGAKPDGKTLNTKAIIIPWRGIKS